jgi:hypothetical protein
MLAARSCSRRDCSFFLEVVVAIDSSRFPKKLRHPERSRSSGGARDLVHLKASDVTPTRDLNQHRVATDYYTERSPN